MILPCSRFGLVIVDSLEILSSRAALPPKLRSEAAGCFASLSSFSNGDRLCSIQRKKVRSRNRVWMQQRRYSLVRPCSSRFLHFIPFLFFATFRYRRARARCTQCPSRFHSALHFLLSLFPFPSFSRCMSLSCAWFWFCSVLPRTHHSCSCHGTRFLP